MWSGRSPSAAGEPSSRPTTRAATFINVREPIRSASTTASRAGPASGKARQPNRFTRQRHARLAPVVDLKQDEGFGAGVRHEPKHPAILRQDHKKAIVVRLELEHGRVARDSGRCVVPHDPTLAIVDGVPERGKHVLSNHTLDVPAPRLEVGEVEVGGGHDRRQYVASGHTAHPKVFDSGYERVLLSRGGCHCSLCDDRRPNSCRQLVRDNRSARTGVEQEHRRLGSVDDHRNQDPSLRRQTKRQRHG
jgi:hypothetical protein